MAAPRELQFSYHHHHAGSDLAPPRDVTFVENAKFVDCSPSSPSAFPEKDDTKFGLAHLLEAAQHCHTVSENGTGHSSKKRKFSSTVSVSMPNASIATAKNPLLSINYLISPTEDERPRKLFRPELALLDQGGPHQYASASPQHDARLSSFQVNSLPVPVPMYHVEPSQQQQTPTGSEASSPNADSKNVWETVLATGNFPDDIYLIESPSINKSSDNNVSNPVKQGRWTNDEKEFAENLIQQVRNGEVVLPPNVSLRKFIADSLQCKAMRVSKKFRSLRSCQSPDGSSSGSGDERRFNPLSLQSIMNEDGDAFQEELDVQSPKRSSKTLKRSDYSQNGAVRSGRWSMEEENYAKAMIEAFKAGYLPLHGNVSLRKFLSEVLVCHPMRISKKFVGYVRKYHWYRIAAGKCDPEAKRQALEQLCHLEREFWASLQLNQEWASIQQENRR